MKQNCFSDREPHRGRMCSDLLEFSYVRSLLVFRSHQRPYSRYLFLSHIKHPRAFRRVEPFVQRSAKVVTLQIVAFEIELRERMGPIDDRLDPTRAGHFADLAHGVDLAG